MVVRNWFLAVALWGILGGILVFTVGCGQKLPSDLPKLYPAQIEVTADGIGLDGAIVTLSLTAGGGESVGGTTDAKGIAKLYTRGQYAGVPAGKYKVCVLWDIRDEKKIQEAKANPVPTDPKELARYNKQIMIAEGKRLPGLETAEYGDPKKTPLEVEVTDGQNRLSVEVKPSAEGKKRLSGG